MSKKHKHKWQFVRRIDDGYPTFSSSILLEFVCECGKIKIVKEKEND